MSKTRFYILLAVLWFVVLMLNGFTMVTNIITGNQWILNAVLVVLNLVLTIMYTILAFESTKIQYRFYCSQCFWDHQISVKNIDDLEGSFWIMQEKHDKVGGCIHTVKYQKVSEE